MISQSFYVYSQHVCDQPIIVREPLTTACSELVNTLINGYSLDVEALRNTEKYPAFADVNSTEQNVYRQKALYYMAHPVENATCAFFK